MENKSLSSPHFAMTIAGSDPSCGAGIQADINVFANLNVHGLSALTCSTAQIPGDFGEIHPVPPDHLAQQLNMLLKSFPVASIKTGLLNSAILMETTLECLEHNRFSGYLIVDPVIQSSSGKMLVDNEGIALFREQFIPRSSLFTPNLNEAAILLAIPRVTEDNFSEVANKLYVKYKVPVLLKGGHLEKDDATDILVTENGQKHFKAPFSHGLSPHGTGCTYSAAITAYIALGHSLEQAVCLAKKYITSAITNCIQLDNDHQLLGRPSL